MQSETGGVASCWMLQNYMHSKEPLLRSDWLNRKQNHSNGGCSNSCVLPAGCISQHLSLSLYTVKVTRPLQHINKQLKCRCVVQYKVTADQHEGTDHTDEERRREGRTFTSFFFTDPQILFSCRFQTFPSRHIKESCSLNVKRLSERSFNPVTVHEEEEEDFLAESRLRRKQNSWRLLRG